MLLTFKNYGFKSWDWTIDSKNIKDFKESAGRFTIILLYNSILDPENFREDCIEVEGLVGKEIEEAKKLDQFNKDFEDKLNESD